MKTRHKIQIVLVSFLALCVLAGFALHYDQKKAASQSTNQNNNSTTAQNNQTQNKQSGSTQGSIGELSWPISNAPSRVTKKPFGIYVTPQNSPVQPEKFTGYHSGEDFETTPAEQNEDVPISAACDGPLKLKEWASGYGGVAVQACTLNGQAVTIIYGHLYVNSIKPVVGEEMTAGEQFAILGQGYSQQTDGERKHLHFGIHKGTAINILGYVQNKSDLSGWLNPADYIK